MRPVTLPGLRASAFAVLFTLLAVAVGAARADVSQDDWSGGPVAPGPVAVWDSGFAASDDVSWRARPGLLALSTDAPASPESHMFDDAFYNSFGVDAVDVDGDGDVDVVGAAAGSYKVLVWFNDGAAIPAWTRQQVGTDHPGATGVAIADFDDDGAPDIVACSEIANGDIRCWLNDGGSPVAWDEQDVDLNWGEAYDVHAADVDGDGRIDIACSAYTPGDVAWWRNGGGDPIVWTRHYVDQDLRGAHSVWSGDLDGDGDLDLVGAGALANSIVWWRNDGGDPIVWTAATISSTVFGARSVRTGDIDGDGRLDVAATGATGAVRWWRNDGGDPVAWTEQTIRSNFVGGHQVQIRDLNGDGRLDVLGVGYYVHDVAWWENGGGDPTAWTEHIVDYNCRVPLCVNAGDLDGDGALEVLASSYELGQFLWYEIGAFRPEGALQSAVLDLGGEGVHGLDWEAEVPAGATLGVSLRAGDDPDTLGAWSTEIVVPGPVATPQGRYVQYRVRLATADSTVSPRLDRLTLATAATAVGDRTPAAVVPALRAWPNPFNPRASVSFAVEADARVLLTVNDLRGRRVAVLADGFAPAGINEVVWDGRDAGGCPAPAGTYLLHLRTDGAVAASRRMSLVR